MRPLPRSPGAAVRNPLAGPDLTDIAPHPLRTVHIYAEKKFAKGARIGFDSPKPGGFNSLEVVYLSLSILKPPPPTTTTKWALAKSEVIRSSPHASPTSGVCWSPASDIRVRAEIKAGKLSAEMKKRPERLEDRYGGWHPTSERKLTGSPLAPLTASSN